MTAAFTAVERFGPGHEAWAGYVSWSGLGQLTELVSLDTMLCPSVVTEMKDAYWDELLLDTQFMHFHFRNLAYLRAELVGAPPHNLLCIVRNPAADFSPPPEAASFRLLGYDLVEDMTLTSALSNCGGFPDSFANAEVNAFGLIDRLDRAGQIQSALRLNHPEEPHADCDVWAIYRE